MGDSDRSTGLAYEESKVSICIIPYVPMQRKQLCVGAPSGTIFWWLSSNYQTNQTGSLHCTAFYCF